jgi:hypothetical protein
MNKMWRDGWPGGNKHPLVLKTVLRTINRVRLLANAISAENLAKELLRLGFDAEQFDKQIGGAGDYLFEVWECMNKQKPYIGAPCQVCGKSTLRDRKHAKYCSRACRQKAYRNRLRDTDDKQSVTRDGSPVTGDAGNVTPLRDGRRASRRTAK